jgi:two-component system sensor histidine kinase BaeS
MSQIDAGGMKLDIQENSISDLVSDTIESFSKLAEKEGVELYGHLAEDIHLVPMDIQQIGRVFSNLVGNALHYTTAGGKVEILVARQSDWLQVQICDTGEGISGEDLPHIFERFYRGEKSRNRNTGGSGLGLAISKGIIEAHGGSIRVESRPGQGACFTFTLPMKRA